MDFVSESEVVMMDGQATIIQSQAAAGQEDGTRLSFQTYGGWLRGSVFGVERLDVLEDGVNTNHFTSFSFGKATGMNPTAFAQWTGVMVGTDTTTGHVIHGDVSVQYTTADAGLLDQVNVANLQNLSSGGDYLVGRINRVQFSDIPLTDGSFESDSGDIKGYFYGNNHREVGGIFNRSNLIGAFGGTKL